MAMYPCDYDRRRYRQAQQSIYWTEISEHLVSSRKLRLCPQHFDLLDEAIQREFVHVEDNSDMPENCEHCGGFRLFTVQARVYRAHTPDEQYVVELCAVCASRLGNDLHVYNAEVLRDRSDGFH
jgi:hypothetical protein